MYWYEVCITLLDEQRPFNYYIECIVQIKSTKAIKTINKLSNN